VVGGLLCGAAGAVAFSVLGRRLRSGRDLFILLFGFTLMLTGLCVRFHLSVILTNMVVGMVIVNTQPRDFGRKLGQELTSVMPLLFVLFFTLAGANLHVAALPALGVLGLVYIVGRSLGLVYGAKLGALVGRAEPKIRKYLGWGILSQAGVAIGLSLIVKHDFAGIGAADASGAAHGDLLGATVITTVTATCIFFEIVGPILTKVALTRAGELGKAREEP
jgi:hypothetical protein